MSSTLFRRATSAWTIGLVALAALMWMPASAADVSHATLDQRRAADFRDAVASPQARRMADWVVATSNNSGLPFVVVDKVRATVFIFDGTGRLRGSTLALMGTARGDGSAAGIGTKRLSAIGPDERTTPAGRFVAVLGRDFEHDVLWIDYALSLSMHRVITGNPGDHRLQRLATTSALDKRITYGCINVPVRFYETVVLSSFAHTKGIVYILPEVRTLEEVFHLGRTINESSGAR